LKEIGVPDYNMFSIHNLRKTSEMYFLSLGIPIEKTLKIFGHSSVISFKHYLSSDVFSFEEKREIHEIMGDIKERLSNSY
jgi:hypothetical protein